MPEGNQTTETSPQNPQISRRQFLKIGALTGAKFVVDRLIPGGSESAARALSMIPSFPEDREVKTEPVRGRIANEILSGKPVKAALFFAGRPNPAAVEFYEEHPVDEKENLMESEADIGKILDQMKSAGINTVALSYWGHEGEDKYSPALYETEKFDWVFEEAKKRNMLVAPFVEVSKDYFELEKEFPQNLTKLIERTTYLTDKYGKYDNWLATYDKDGRARKTFYLIDTISDNPLATPKEFAGAFDIAAETIKNATGKSVGFVISPQPLGYNLTENISPETLGVLAKTASVLSAAPFNPAAGKFANEVADGRSDQERINYEDWALSKLANAGIPVYFPAVPGYLAQKVFGIDSPKFGLTDEWLSKVLILAKKGKFDGTFFIWNGYTESFGIAPTKEYFDKFLLWAKAINEQIN